MEENRTESVELTDEEMEVEKQKIRDNVSGVSTDDTEEDVKLPSEEAEGKKYAGVYESIDELKKGIINLKADVPDYMLNGMNEEALEQYYTDLRKEFSSKPKEATDDIDYDALSDEELDKIIAEDSDGEKADKPTDAISDDLWKELDAEFSKNGGISDEHYDKLKQLGIPSNVVDKYIDGLRSEATMFTSKVYELAGGEEQYNDIKAWAEENYSQAELDMIAQGNFDEILFKMKAVKADYDSKTNKGSQRVVGGNTSSANGYTSAEDYMRDVMSREYKSNPKYKAKVDSKFRASKFGYGA